MRFAEGVALVLGVALGSWMFVAMLRRYAVARGILDQPSARSSHEIPTPRGGGAGLVVAAILGFIVATPFERLDWRIVLALAAVLPTGVVGWLDDRRSLPVGPRFLAHLASAVMLLPLALASGGTLPSTLLVAGWVIATISAINVVNFMDGIDGLIGLQALIFGVHLHVLGIRGTPGDALGLCLAAAATGFLLLNWSPARIFLGDVGSGAIAVLGVVGGILVYGSTDWDFLAVFLPLLPIFLDASVTMLRRAKRGENLAQAHRSHLYQRLANDAGWGHAKVSLIFGVASSGATIAVAATPATARTAMMAVYASVVLIAGSLLERAAPRPTLAPVSAKGR